MFGRFCHRSYWAKLLHDVFEEKERDPFLYFNLSFTIKIKGGAKFIRAIFSKQKLEETNGLIRFKKLSEL